MTSKPGAKKKDVVVSCLYCNKPHKRTAKYWHIHPHCMWKTEGYVSSFNGNRRSEPKSRDY